MRVLTQDLNEEMRNKCELFFESKLSALAESNTDIQRSLWGNYCMVWWEEAKEGAKVSLTLFSNGRYPESFVETLFYELLLEF